MTNSNENLAILNPSGKIEIKEFFDYNCGHCKKEYQVIKELLNKVKDVKIILYAIPILGESSLYATQIGHAILISEPNNYLKYYESIMSDFNSEGDSILLAIKASGVNLEKLKDTLKTNSEEIANRIKTDMNLADKFGVQGTPALIINDELIPGAINLEELISILNKE